MRKIKRSDFDMFLLIVAILLTLFIVVHTVCANGAVLLLDAKNPTTEGYTHVKRGELVHVLMFYRNEGEMSATATFSLEYQGKHYTWQHGMFLLTNPYFPTISLYIEEAPDWWFDIWPIYVKDDLYLTLCVNGQCDELDVRGY